MDTAARHSVTQVWLGRGGVDAMIILANAATRTWHAAPITALPSTPLARPWTASLEGRVAPTVVPGAKGAVRPQTDEKQRFATSMDVEGTPAWSPPV
jgi:hypothetical protein